MNNFVGWVREKMGRSTHKAVLMVPISETVRFYPDKHPNGTSYTPQPRNQKLRAYEAVAAHYFRPNEVFWNYKKDATYELHAENTSYIRNEAKLQFLNKYTGAPIGFDELQQVVFTPEALTQTIASKWVQAAHQSVKGLSMGLIVSLVVFGFGLVVGLLVGTNTGTIQAILQPTPTPPVMFTP